MRILQPLKLAKQASIALERKTGEDDSPLPTDRQKRLLLTVEDQDEEGGSRQSPTDSARQLI